MMGIDGEGMNVYACTDYTRFFYQASTAQSRLYFTVGRYLFRGAKVVASQLEMGLYEVDDNHPMPWGN